MARTKKVEEVVNEEVVNETVTEEATTEEVEEVKPVKSTKTTTQDDTLKQENETLKNQLNEQTNQIAQLSQMLAQLQAQMLNSQAVQPVAQAKDDEVILLGSAMYGRESLTDSFGHEVVVFNGFGDVKPIAKDLFNSVYIPKNERLFRSGLIYFVGESEKYYDIKKIKRPLVILSEDEIVNILQQDNVEMTKLLNKATANKTNVAAMSNLANIIALVIIKGRVNSNPMLLQTLSSYFNMQDFNKPISMVMWASQSGICSNNVDEY